MKKIIVVILISLVSQVEAKLIYDSNTGNYHNVNIDINDSGYGSANVRVRDYSTGNTYRGNLNSDYTGGYTGNIRDYNGHSYKVNVDAFGNTKIRQRY